MDDQLIPCQILCFVYLEELVSNDTRIGGYLIDTPGNYAIVRRFEKAPKTIPQSSFVQSGQLLQGLFLVDCDSIHSEIAVVPEIWNIGNQDETNVQQQSTCDGRFFVVQNRTYWLEMFMKEMKRVSRFSKKKLHEQGPDINDDKSTLSDDEVNDNKDEDDSSTKDFSDDEVNDDRDESESSSLEEAGSVSTMEDSDTST